MAKKKKKRDKEIVARSGNIKIFLAGEDEHIANFKKILKENHSDICIVHPKNEKVMAILATCDFDALVVDRSFAIPHGCDEFLDWKYLINVSKDKCAAFFLLVESCTQARNVCSNRDGYILTRPHGSHQVEFALEKAREAREKSLEAFHLAV